MNTIDRINKLMVFCDLPVISPKRGLHDAINSLDDSLGVNTEFPTSLQCSCLYHIGKACHARRTVGARLALLESKAAHVMAGNVSREYLKKWGGFQTAPI